MNKECIEAALHAHNSFRNKVAGGMQAKDLPTASRMAQGKNYIFLLIRSWF